MAAETSGAAQLQAVSYQVVVRAGRPPNLDVSLMVTSPLLTAEKAIAYIRAAQRNLEPDGPQEGPAEAAPAKRILTGESGPPDRRGRFWLTDTGEAALGQDA